MTVMEPTVLSRAWPKTRCFAFGILFVVAYNRALKISPAGVASLLACSLNTCFVYFYRCLYYPKSSKVTTPQRVHLRLATHVPFVFEGLLSRTLFFAIRCLVRPARAARWSRCTVPHLLFLVRCAKKTPMAVFRFQIDHIRNERPSTFPNI